MLLATALALLITGDASTDVYCSKQPAAVAPKGNHHPSFSFLELGRRKNRRWCQICGGAENVVKTETQQTFVKWIARFYYFRHWVPLEARVYCSHNCMSCPSISNSSALLINIPSFQLFLHSDQPSEGEIIPFSGVCQSGRLHYPRRRRWWLHALTDRLLWCATGRRPAATSSRRASFSALASANSFVYFASSAANITLTHLHVSNCRVRQLQFSGIFVALGFVGNGVITVMINSPWQADDGCR